CHLNRSATSPSTFTLSVVIQHAAHRLSIPFVHARVEAGQWTSLVVTHSNHERLPWKRSELRVYVNGALSGRAQTAYRSFGVVDECFVGNVDVCSCAPRADDGATERTTPAGRSPSPPPSSAASRASPRDPSPRSATSAHSHALRG